MSNHARLGQERQAGSSLDPRNPTFENAVIPTSRLTPFLLLLYPPRGMDLNLSEDISIAYQVIIRDLANGLPSETERQMRTPHPPASHVPPSNEFLCATSAHVNMASNT